jgi:hypothetical protein
MAIPILRRYAFRGAPFVDGILNVAMRGANIAPLANIDYAQVQDCFSATHVQQQDMASYLISSLQNDRPTYLKGIGDYAHLVGMQAIEQQKKEFGLDASTWSRAAKRRVFSNNFSTPDAHAVVVVSLEPTPDPEKTVRDFNLQRMALGIFPGGGATINDSIYADMIAGGRAIDGTPVNAIIENWLDIKKINRDAFQKRDKVIGSHLLGDNSVIHSLNQDVFDHNGGTIQSTLNMTSMLHSQHGIVPWSFYAHPSFDGVICTSLHFGAHPIIGGDIVNAAISPALFKNVFRRTVLLNNNFERLKTLVGEDALSELLLNPEVVKNFRDILAHEDFALITDAAFLSGLDATGGAMFNEMHLFTNTRVSEVNIKDLMETNKCDDFNAVGEEGEKRAVDLGNFGELGFIRPKPSDFVPDFGSLESGVIQNTTDASSNWADCPLPTELESLRTSNKVAIDALIKKIDWDKIQETASTSIKDNARDTLQGFETRMVVGSSTDHIATVMLDDGLKSKISSSMANNIEQQLIGDANFQKLIKSFNPDITEGLKIAKQLILIDAIAPRFQSASMNSYLNEKLIVEIASHKVTLMQNHEGEITSAISESETSIGQTSSEKNAAQKELIKIQNEIKLDPPNKDVLESQEAQLQQQLDDLAKQEKALEDQKDQAESMNEAAEHDRSSEAESSAESYGKEAFANER